MNELPKYVEVEADGLFTTLTTFNRKYLKDKSYCRMCTKDIDVAYVAEGSPTTEVYYCYECVKAKQGR